MNKLNAPQLRFKDFTDEWQEKKLGSFLNERIEFSKAGYPLYSLTIEDGVTPKTERYERSFLVKSEDDAYKVVKQNDFVYNPMNLRFGAIARYKNVNPVCVSKYYNIFYSDGSTDPRFLELYLTRKTMLNFYDLMATGSLVEKRRVHYSDFVKFNKPFPLLGEQQKIAEFLATIDDKIEKLVNKKKSLEKFKKGSMQAIFSRKIRFKRSNGSNYQDWSEKNLFEVLIERKERNLNNEHKEVFSVAKNAGIVNQIEHLGRSFAANDISNYKVVHPFDIVYTKSPTSDFPYGIVKQNKLARFGVVSVLYGVYQPINKNIGNILDWYFGSWKNTFNYLNPIVRKGAKNTINISDSGFLGGSKIFLPRNEEEQEKIAEFLTVLDNKIDLINKELELVELFKKALLQKMFV